MFSPSRQASSTFNIHLRLKELYSSRKKSAIEDIKNKLQIVINDDNSDFSEFVNAVDHDYDLPPIVDCLIYYTAEIVCTKHLKMLTCSLCKNAFINTVGSVKNIESSVKMNRPDARLINADKLVHPNSAVFNIIKKVEQLFYKYCTSKNVFECIVHCVQLR